MVFRLGVVFKNHVIYKLFRFTCGKEKRFDQGTATTLLSETESMCSESIFIDEDCRSSN